MLFDHAILDGSGNEICLIERQGKQHYEPVCLGGIGQEGANANVEGQQRRDKIKRADITRV